MFSTRAPLIVPHRWDRVGEYAPYRSQGGGGCCSRRGNVTLPCLPTFVGVECQALNAAHKGPPRTGYRRDVGRGAMTGRHGGHDWSAWRLPR